MANLMASAIRCCGGEDALVARTILGAIKNLCIAAPKRMLELPDDQLKHLFFALERLVVRPRASCIHMRLGFRV